MQGIIEVAKASKSGKTLGVKFQGSDTWYSTKNWELQGMVGQEITAQTSESEFNGAIMHWLNDYQEVGASTTTADAAFDAAHAAAQTAPPMGSPAPHPTPRLRDKDATIGALALTKSVPGSPQEVWAAFEYFYDRLLTWQKGDVDPDDAIPF